VTGLVGLHRAGDVAVITIASLPVAALEAEVRAGLAAALLQRMATRPSPWC
jgi:hypothetical protein